MISEDNNDDESLGYNKAAQRLTWHPQHAAVLTLTMG